MVMPKVVLLMLVRQLLMLLVVYLSIQMQVLIRPNVFFLQWSLTTGPDALLGSEDLPQGHQKSLWHPWHQVGNLHQLQNHLLH